MKVVTGKINSGTEVYNERAGKMEKAGSNCSSSAGKEQLELNYAEAGDIVAVAKLAVYPVRWIRCATRATSSATCRWIFLRRPIILLLRRQIRTTRKNGNGTCKLREEDPSLL